MHYWRFLTHSPLAIGFLLLRDKLRETNFCEQQKTCLHFFLVLSKPDLDWMDNGDEGVHFGAYFTFFLQQTNKTTINNNSYGYGYGYGIQLRLQPTPTNQPTIATATTYFLLLFTFFFTHDRPKGVSGYRHRRRLSSSRRIPKFELRRKNSRGGGGREEYNTVQLHVWIFTRITGGFFLLFFFDQACTAEQEQERIARWRVWRWWRGG